MKQTHLTTARTLDECQFTYPPAIEHYRAPGALRKLLGVVLVCVVCAAVIVLGGRA